MPITVVTTRSDEGVPTTKDVYAAGVGYRIGNSNLEILSATKQLLALYPSGNWLSVHIDQLPTVATGVPDADDETPTADPTDPADPADPADPRSAGGPVDLVDGDPGSDRGSGPTGPTAPQDLPEWSPERTGPQPAAEVADAAGDASAQGSLPAGMRPVRFRLRPFRKPASPPPTEPSERPRMQPLTFRLRTFTPPTGDSAPRSEDTAPRMMPVNFRLRRYRAVQDEPAAEPDLRPDAQPEDIDAEPGDDELE